MNNVNIIGNLTKEPELRTTPNGINYVGFSVAVDRPCGKDGIKRTDFFDCIAWRKTAEFICKFFGKGDRIALTGVLESDIWRDRDGKTHKTVAIRVTECTFVAFIKKGKAEREDSYPAPPPYPDSD